MKTNKYVQNVRENYIGNVATTVMFSGLWVYALFSSSFFFYGFVIAFSVLWLYFYTLKPAYKIFKGRATYGEMSTFRLTPFGIGLLCIYGPPYQRMTSKLTQEEAILVCKGILKGMETKKGTRQFKVKWDLFKEEFPKIQSSVENRGIRHALLMHVLCAKGEYEERRVKEKLRNKLIIILCTKALKEVNLADFLTDEILEKLIVNPMRDCVCVEDDVSQMSMDGELKKVSGFDKLKEGLNEANTHDTFVRMYEIGN